MGKKLNRSRPQYGHRDPLQGAPRLVLHLDCMTKHAVDRALEMAVGGEEIRECLERPRRAFYDSAHGVWVYSRGRISLPVAFEAQGPRVTTVLWSSDGGWRTDAQVAPMPKGRDRYAQAIA